MWKNYAQLPWGRIKRCPLCCPLPNNLFSSGFWWTVRHYQFSQGSAERWSRPVRGGSTAYDLNGVQLQAIYAATLRKGESLNSNYQNNKFLLGWKLFNILTSLPATQLFDNIIQTYVIRSAKSSIFEDSKRIQKKVGDVTEMTQTFKVVPSLISIVSSSGPKP